MDDGVVEAARATLLGRKACCPGDRLDEGRTVRDVRARVLVVERLVEGQPGLADAGAAVDERDLAERRAALVRRHLGAHDVGARGRMDVDRVASLEAQLEIANDRAEHRQRARRPDDALRTPPVRRGVHLLGRHVRHAPLAPGRLVERRLPHAAVEQADRQIGTRTAEVDGVEVPRGQRRRPHLQPRDVVAPGRHRAGLVQADGGGDRLPQPLDVGLAEHRPRPARSGAADDRARDSPFARKAPYRLRELDGVEPSDPFPVEVGEQVGLGLGQNADGDGLVGRSVLESLDEPGRSPRQRLVGTQLDERPVDVLIEMEDVHEARARPVAGASELAHERRVLDVAVDVQELSGTEVDADADGQVGVPRQPIVRRQRPLAPAARPSA